MLSCLMVLTACGAASSDSAMCASTLDFDGRSYYGYGDTTVIPPETRTLGEGTLPPCDDGHGESPAQTARVRRLAGFTPTEAVVVGREQIFIAEDLEPFPDRIRKYFDPVMCATDGSFTLAGQWIGVSPGAEGDLEPPYRITVLARSGSDGGEHYRRSYVDVHITPETAPELGRADVRIALWEPGTVTGRVHCEEQRFVAETVEASGQSQ